MSTKIIRNNLTDAELIDEGLDCDVDSLAYLLAVRLDALPISCGSVQVDDSSCEDCDELQNEIHHLEHEVSRLESDLENLDIDRLILLVPRKLARLSSKRMTKLITYSD